MQSNEIQLIVREFCGDRSSRRWCISDRQPHSEQSHAPLPTVPSSWNSENCSSVMITRNIPVSTAPVRWCERECQKRRTLPRFAKPKVFSPAFAAPYARNPGNGSFAATDDMFTITPPPCLLNAGQQTFARTNAAVRLVSITRCHSSRLVSSIERIGAVPATCMAASTRQKRWSDAPCPWLAIQLRNVCNIGRQDNCLGAGAGCLLKLLLCCVPAAQVDSGAIQCVSSRPADLDQRGDNGNWLFHQLIPSAHQSIATSRAFCRAAR